MNRTPIEWVVGPDGKRGFTWNPVVGCSRGCDYCYARRIAQTRLAHHCPDCAAFRPHLHPERLRELTPRQKPRGIFVCSMGELFDPEWNDPGRISLAAIFAAMNEMPQHRYYILTKRPERLHKWMDFQFDHPRDNWWLGVSAATQAEVDERVPELLRLREYGWPVLFLSLEPLLGPVDLSAWLGFAHEDEVGGTNPDQSLAEAQATGFHDPWVRGLDWVIVGAQTGPEAVRPDRRWIEGVVRQCHDARVPCFVKDNARRQWDPALEPALDARQEFPRP